MSEYRLAYEPQLDTFQLYYRYVDGYLNGDQDAATVRGPALPALGNAVAGSVAAVISSVTIYPLSLIVTRLQNRRSRAEGDDAGPDESGSRNQKPDKSGSIFDMARKIIEEEGIAGLYTGISQNTAKTAVDSFIFFLAYTFFRRQRIRARLRTSGKKNVILPIPDELAVGVLAGSFGKLFTMPLANIVTRKQVSVSNVNKGNLSTKDVAARILTERGIAGFWAGYSAALILTLNPAITFLLNEILKRATLSRAKIDNPPKSAIFILAAISKAAASSITYPLSLAMTRAQAGSLGIDTDSGNSCVEGTDADGTASFTPKILSAVIKIAQTEGVGALYSGLSGEVFKGFFSHGLAMLAKDMIHASVVRLYHLLLITLRRYPSPEELIARTRRQAEGYMEAGTERVKDVAEKAKFNIGEVAGCHSSSAAAYTASAAEDTARHNVKSLVERETHWPRPHSDFNETAELVGDYVEDEADEWKSLYHWFWEKDRK